MNVNMIKEVPPFLNRQGYIARYRLGHNWGEGSRPFFGQSNRSRVLGVSLSLICTGFVPHPYIQVYGRVRHRRA